MQHGSTYHRRKEGGRSPTSKEILGHGVGITLDKDTCEDGCKENGFPHGLLTSDQASVRQYSSENGELSEYTFDVHLHSLSPEKLMVVPVTVTGEVYDALIDTGASASLIKLSLVQDCMSTIGSKRVVTGLGGNTVVSLGIANVEFRILSCGFKESFMVVPDEDIKHSVILGNTFFLSNKVTVDLSRSRLSGSNLRGSWEVYVDNPVTHIVYRELEVCVSEDIWINDLEPSLVPVSVKGLEGWNSTVHDLYYDGDIRGKWANHFKGTEGIVSVTSGRSALLIEKQSSGRSCEERLRKGTVLGTLSTIVDFEVVDVCALISDNCWSGEEIEQVVSLNNLTTEESKQVVDMLLRRSTVLSTGDHDIGCAGVTEHRIELYDSTPIRQRPRRFAEPVVNEIERQCDELKKLDIIECSRSPWSSPVVPIKKKDGTLRLCIDYRQLNRVTKADRFPMPNINDLVFGLHGTRYFTTLDLVKGYYQVPLNPDSAECTAFSTTRSHYQFKRLSFGLKNAPAAFQREMLEVLRNFDSKHVVVYIDDILILSKSFEEHIVLVEKVLATLEKFGMKIKLSKCCWFQAEVAFLGHLVGRGGIKKSPEYVRSVQEFPQPSTIKELRSFLGLVNFQRKFIPQCSVLSRPLTRLMGASDSTKLRWCDEMQRAFVALKEAMSKDVDLAYPNYSPSAPRLELSTDASKFGAGACLTQFQGDDERVIAYASTTFNKAQTNYSTIEQELAAIRWAVKVFRSFIYGVPFILFTDHRPLVYMSNMSQQNARITRTMNELAEYDFEIRYRAGKDNVIADTLSRLLSPSTSLLETASAEHLSEGLTVLKIIEGGGDSLVRSLWEVLIYYRGQYNPSMAIPDTESELRLELVAELMSDPGRYGIKGDKTMKNKLKMARLPGQLPPLEFLVAFSQLYKLQVWVHHGLDKPVVFSTRDQAGTTSARGRVHLRCLAGIHYNPVTENKLYIPPICGTEHNIEEVSVETCLDCSVVDDSIETAVTCNTLQFSRSCSCQHSAASAVTTVQVGDKTYCALMDTGAQISLISDNVLRQLRSCEQHLVSFEPQTVKIRSLGSSGTHTQGVVDISWRLAGHEIEGVPPFALVEEKAMPFCVILGANTIRQLGLEINFAARLFSFKSGTRRVTCSLDVIPLQVVEGEVCLVQDNLEIESDYNSDDAEKLEKLQLLPALLTSSQLRKVQRRDKVIRLLHGKIKAGKPSNTWKQRCLHEFRRYYSQLSVIDGDLWFGNGDYQVMVVPFPFLIEIVLQTHYQMSHLGRNKLLKIVQRTLWHPSMHNVIVEVCASCIVCQRFKVSSNLYSPPIQRIQIDNPFQLLAADLIQLTKTRSGNIGCLVVVDHCSKWASVVPIKNKKAETVASALEHRVLPTLPRKPDKILTDNGAEFVSSVFNQVLDQYGVRHVYSSPYKPSCNGAVERLNRTLSEMLRCVVTDSQRWDDFVSKAVVNYNHSWHSAIAMSPSEYLMRNRHEVRDIPLLEGNTQAQWKDGHPSFAPFCVGDLVLKKVQLMGNLVSNKFLPRFDGPYKVLHVNSNGVSYRIVGEHGNNEVRAHHTQLKKFIAPPKYLTDHPSYQGKVSRDIPIVDGHDLVTGQKDECVYSTEDDSIEYDSQLDFSGFETLEPRVSFSGHAIDGDFCRPPGDHILAKDMTSPTVQSIGCVNNSPVADNGRIVEQCDSMPVSMADNSRSSAGYYISRLTPDIPFNITGCSVRQSTPDIPQNMPRPSFSLSSVAVQSPELRSSSDLPIHTQCELREQDCLLGSALDVLGDQDEVLENIQSTINRIMDEAEAPLIVVESPHLVIDTAMTTPERDLILPAAPTGVQRDNVLSMDNSHENVARVTVEGQVTDNFSGFTSPSLQQDNVAKLLLARRRVSLEPVRSSLREVRDIIGEYRRRSRSRILSQCRSGLSDLPSTDFSLDSEKESIIGPSCYRTRSRGPVPDQSNVQHGTLEYGRR